MSAEGAEYVDVFIETEREALLPSGSRESTSDWLSRLQRSNHKGDSTWGDAPGFHSSRRWR